jgi:hypothetical protein
MDRPCVNVREGDWVVVERDRVPYVGMVVDKNPLRQQCKRATKWLVARIDWDPYIALTALAPAEEDDA